MDQILLEKVQALKSYIDNSDEIKELNHLNELLEKDEEVMKLAYLKDMKLLKYEDSLKHFKEDSEEVKQAQKELHKAKLDLDSNVLVKKYNAQYKIVKEMYDKINEEIFNPFK